MDGPEDPPKLALFIPSFGDGGVERMLVNLAKGMAQQGVSVDFVVRQGGSPYLALLPAQARLVELRASEGIRGFLAAVRYLRDARPRVVLSGKGSDDRLSLRARRWAGVPVRCVLITGTSLSGRLRARGRGALYRWRKLRAVRRLYAQADAIIAVSRGVAEDVASITELPADRIRVAPNPVVTPELERLAREPADHPWLARKDVPVILGVGGLRLQKDFETLLRAFAEVRRERPCRLLIVGEGRRRERLEALSRALGIQEHVSLPGFRLNPYAYMAAADVFVLSSRWEGFGSVLVEALALGLPAVSTDCPVGPREILQDGRFGPLVPVGDARAMAQAIRATLTERPAPDVLRTAARPYTMEASARAYLEALDLAPERRTPER
jgi:glycosyltransferase involved in cell wall biosynthesis